MTVRRVGNSSVADFAMPSGADEERRKQRKHVRGDAARTTTRRVLALPAISLTHDSDDGAHHAHGDAGDSGDSDGEVDEQPFDLWPSAPKPPALECASTAHPLAIAARAPTLPMDDAMPGELGIRRTSSPAPFCSFVDCLSSAVLGAVGSDDALSALRNALRDRLLNLSTMARDVEELHTHHQQLEVHCARLQDKRNRVDEAVLHRLQARDLVAEQVAQQQWLDQQLLRMEQRLGEGADTAPIPPLPSSLKALVEAAPDKYKARAHLERAQSRLMHLIACFEAE